MEEKEYYIGLHIYRDHKHLWSMVWCGKRGWMGVEEVHQCMFRVVPLFTSKEAYKIREEMLGTGYFSPPIFDRGVLKLCVEGYWGRSTYIFCGWDEEEGSTAPIAAIRCDGWYQAEKYFQEHYPEQFKYAQGQVKHISDCKYKWPNEIKELDLDADLIAAKQFPEAPINTN